MGFVVGAVAGIVATMVFQVVWADFTDWWADFVEDLKSWGRTAFAIMGGVAIFLCLLYVSGWRP